MSTVSPVAVVPRRQSDAATDSPKAVAVFGRYLYAVVPARQASKDYGSIGLGGRPVYVISNGRVAAVVSDLPNERLRPQRAHLAAHHGVLKHLMAAEESVLPISFGVIADGPFAVQKFLSANQARFVAALEQVRGTAEMGLRVSWDVPNIFEYFVAAHEDLRALRDHLFRGGREPAHNDKIELGRLFDRCLQDDRAAHLEHVLAVLRPRCRDIRENPPRDEREVLHLACLVERGQAEAFEQAVFEAARRFDGHFAFDFNGPWPPYNFVDTEVEV